MTHFVTMAKPVGSYCNMRCSYCYYLKADNGQAFSSLRMNDEVLEGLPQAPPEFWELICEKLIEKGAIPKKDLVVGTTYTGVCRNSDEATWLGDKFEYVRYKFGIQYKDTINHFEDDDGYDLFVPLNIKDSN